ncbi:tyrosine-type recombinase/integrase [Bartonella sp. DGB1]|uniref:tyrosine-type recombinase/integrase n=1 Tax=Bartonella sp. DGB1 TaxID=3239807 RepID=UPI003524116B
MKYCQLNNFVVKNAPRGRYCDGGGLWLEKSNPKTGFWFLRYSANGKRKTISLGSIRFVSLKEAREKAVILRKNIHDGILPKSKSAEKENSLEKIIYALFESKKDTLKNNNHEKWLSPLKVHIFPKIGNMPIEKINQDILYDCLKPLWRDKNETASKILGRINLAMKYAVAKGLKVDLLAIPNVKILLGKSLESNNHIPSMPWQEIPLFFECLNNELISNLALKLLILTGVRSGSIRNMRWSQIEGDVWTIPAEYLKGQLGKISDFRVPLSKQALEVLDIAKTRKVNDLVFSSSASKPISDATMSKFMKDMGLDARPHGFRSSLRNWLAEELKAPYEIAETILSHVIGQKVQRAYLRTDFLEQRREIMQKWADFVVDKKG